MNGFEMIAEQYKELLKQEKIDEQTANKEIRIYDFLAECEKDDFYRLVDSGAFNDIVKAYMHKALEGAGVDNETTDKVMEELRWLFDTKQAREVCE